MENIVNIRYKVRSEIEAAEVKINTILSDTDLSLRGKNKQVEPIREEAKGLLQSAISEFNQERIKKEHEAVASLPKVDPAAVAARAAIIGPALANMDYEAILTLYEARYNDPVERDLIQQIAQIKIDTAPDTIQAVQFKEKFPFLQQRLKSTLPDYQDQVKAAAEIKYLNNVTAAFNYELQEMQGAPVKGPDMVHRTNANFEAAQFEEAINRKAEIKPPPSLTVKEAVEAIHAKRYKGTLNR